MSGTSPESRAGAETRRYGRSASLLTLAVGLAGLLTYVFFALLSHSLEGADYGAVVVVWSAVFITSSTCFRPVEQLLARALAELGGHPGAAARRVLAIAVRVQLSVLALVLVAALALHGPIADGLLASDEALYLLALAALVGFAASFFARGMLAGGRRTSGYAAIVLIESTVRICFALAIAAGLSDDPAVAAAGIAAAPLASLLALPLVLRRAARATPGAAAGGEGAAATGGLEPRFTLAAGGAFAACVLVIMLSEQLLISSGVLFVRAAEGAASAGLMFNELMLIRAPLVLFLAIAASLLPHLATLRARGGDAEVAAFRAAVRRTVAVIGGFASLVVLTVAAAGPELMRLAFGPEHEYERIGLAIVATGLGFYLSASTLSQAALAQGQARRAAACWALSAAAFVAWNALAGLEEVRRVEVGLTASAILLCALLYGVYRHPPEHAEELIEPGSPRELELDLATADEVA